MRMFLIPSLLFLFGCATQPKEEPSRSISSTPPFQIKVPDNFNMREELNYLACNIARGLSPLDDRSAVDARRSGIRLDVKDLGRRLPDVLDGIEEQSRFEKTVNQFLFSNKDIFLPYSFVLQAKNFKGSNFAMAVNSVIANEKEKDENYSAINDVDFYQKAKDEEKALGAVLVQREFIGAGEAEAVHDRVSFITSPLVEWLIQQPKSSISPSAFFNKALEIYRDPWVAIGAVSTVSQQIHEPRSQNAVIASRLNPLFREEVSDHSGTQYHFWGYLIRVLLNPNDSFRLRSLSFGYEMIKQRDHQDYYADHWGIETALAINRQWMDTSDKPCSTFDDSSKTSIPTEGSLVED